MKRILVFTLCCMLGWWGTAFGQLNDGLHVMPQEIYIAVYPANQYLEIIEYNLVSTRKQADTVITDDVEQIVNSIKTAEYASQRYGFDLFVPVEEELSNQTTHIKAHSHLLSRERNAVALLRDVFENILNRPVELAASEEEIHVTFTGDDIGIADNNALGVFEKGAQRIMVWKAGMQKYEIVISIDVRGKPALLPFIDTTVRSPKVSAEEVDAIKRGSPPLPKADQEFQNDADIYRLRHLQYYGELVEAYHEKTGRYPLQGGSELPVYVFIANRKQESYTKQKNPNPHTIIPLKQFFQELEGELGITIQQVYDPQYVPVGRPNFYLYMINGDTYFLAVHVANYYPFATKVADHYYKVEISNNPPEKTRIRTYDALLEDARFQTAIRATPAKEAFFLKREAAHRHDISTE